MKSYFQLQGLLWFTYSHMHIPLSWLRSKLQFSQLPVQVDLRRLCGAVFSSPGGCYAQLWVSGFSSDTFY
jgi:hypothetical protein